ncbi:beta-1,4-galactosyltransferase 4-like [Clavelina lepadiformis]|uniref:beta-1,4-galactosyltransferase 4-like n=1 Tax=Clavelina lepadiformis TaxID=159417 RepID=UPI0040432BDC
MLRTKSFKYRQIMDQITIRWLGKVMFLSFVFLQLALFIRNTGNYQDLDEVEMDFRQFSEEQADRRGRGIPEERFGDRRIRSFPDETEGEKKLHFRHSGKLDNPRSRKSIEPTMAMPARELDDGRASDDGYATKPLCPLTPPNLLGRLEFHFNATPPTLQQVADNNPFIRKGGAYHPPDCVARYRIAFIVPHRSRELHLRALLWHLHPILQRQQLYYKIYVVHQAGNLAFNKAKLMNIGYLEAMKDDVYDCVVFHDVDLLPEDDRLLYSCIDTPKHLSVAIDKYGYRLPYISLFGGVTMLTKEQFHDVNGYSNMYWGWGGEDDDMFNRIFTRGYTIKRPPFHLARYKMTFHHRDKGNRLNLMRYEILSHSVKRMQEDGLNNVKYTITSTQENPVYTNVTADVGTAVVQCKPYLAEWTCSLVLWMCEYLTLSCGMLQYNSTDDGTLVMPLKTDFLR